MKAVQRYYNMSDADLMMLASKLVFNMTRDAAEFAARGVDAAAISAFEALGNAFEVFPTDEVYVGEIKDATAAKNSLRQSSTLMIQTISGYFDQMWGIGSGKYTSLRVKSLFNLSNSNFLLTARTVVARATANLAALAAIGLTQSDIDALTAEAQLFEDALIDVVNKKEIRDTKANERTQKGNELYSFAAKYSKVGKLIWENVDESKYNDYVIYPSSNPSLSKPQNLAAALDPMNILPVTLTWDLVADATSYDVYTNVAATGAPAGSFNLLNTFATSPADVPPMFDKRNYYKIKAKNATEVGPYSDEAFVDVPAAP